jgi:hypothetical protein
MTDKKSKKEKWIIILVSFVISAVMLTICSKSSFLYPINDWVDANIYFTIGKSIARGKVLYRDVFDHKGPLLYFLHSLAYLISHTTFLGVYFIEVIAFAFFLIAVYRILRLYTDKNAMLALPVIAALIVSSKSFCHGDSAEELCLPLLMWSLYEMLRYLKEGNGHMSYRTIFLHGILAGCIMLIKYTILGFHFAWILAVFLSCIIKKDWKRGIQSGLVFVGGMIATMIPFFLYFGLNHALKDWYTVYIYDNIFAYSNIEKVSLFNQVKGMLKMLFDTFLDNWKYSIFTIFGVIWFTFQKRVSPFSKCVLWMMCICSALGICWGVVYMHPYYSLILSIFSCIGFIPLIQWGSKKGQMKPIGLVILLCLSMGYAWKTGNYTDEIGTSKDEVVQYQFKEIIEEKENPSLLNFAFMDGGFYTVCDIVPTCKYFCKTNMPGNEWIDEQLACIEEGWVDFVVTRDYMLPEKYTLYQLAASAEDYYEGEAFTYYLYQKIE